MKKNLYFLTISLFFYFSYSNDKGISAYFTPTPAPITEIDSIDLPQLSSSPVSAYQAVIKSMMAAKKSIYLVAYEFNIYHLTQLLLDRLKDGVKVFLLVEANNLKLPETFFLLDQLYRGGAHIFPDQKKGGIMHNKFIVIDEKVLITGSANFSINAFFQQYNDIVVIDHPYLAREYLKQFTELTEKIYRKRSSRPSLEPKTYFDQKNPDIRYQVVFSRSIFDPTQIMVDTISTCRQRINFLIFAFSSQPITQAMQNCLHKKNKVKVTGIFDNAFESENITRNWKTIPFQILWENGADVKYDNVKEKIHHKNLVIDDRTVITGSFNFSANAQKNNDENYIIIQSPDLAAQYQKRFKTLWEQFPTETLFETYIQARNQKQTTLSFQEYEKRSFNRKISAVNKELQNGKFQGQVVLIEDGNTVIIKLNQSGERIRVTLAGIIAPISGNHKYHQEPQSHLAKEALILNAAQRQIIGKVVEGKNFNIHAIIYVKNDKDKKTLKSINKAMIESGLVYPLWNGKDHSSITYKKHPAWVMELPQLQKALEKVQKEKRKLWGELALTMSPLEFLEKMEENKLQRKLLENQYSQGNYKKKFWIGNRKTRKVYPPGSPTYMEYLRDLNDKKLIFFQNQKDAKSAGYLIRNEKNY